MLEPKDILRIDATVIAGVFILLTISTLGAQPTTSQVVNEFIDQDKKLADEIESKEKELSQLLTELEKTQQEKNTILTKIDEINKKPQEIQDQIQKINQDEKELTQNMTSGKLTKEEFEEQISEKRALKRQYVKDLREAEQKLGLKELQDSLFVIERDESELNSKITQTKNEIELLKKKQVEAREQFKIDLKESASSFLKKPADWIYLGGMPFAISAIFALISDFIERYEKIRGIKVAIYSSLGFMGLGFVFLTVIFYKVWVG